MIDKGRLDMTELDFGACVIGLMSLSAGGYVLLRDGRKNGVLEYRVSVKVPGGEQRSFASKESPLAACVAAWVFLMNTNAAASLARKYPEVLAVMG